VIKFPWVPDISSEFVGIETGKAAEFESDPIVRYDIDDADFYRDRDGVVWVAKRWHGQWVRKQIFKRSSLPPLPCPSKARAPGTPSQAQAPLKKTSSQAQAPLKRTPSQAQAP
jgi:hypothetical protein